MGQIQRFRQHGRTIAGAVRTRQPGIPPGAELNALWGWSYFLGVTRQKQSTVWSFTIPTACMWA